MIRGVSTVSLVLLLILHTVADLAPSSDVIRWCVVALQLICFLIASVFGVETIRLHARVEQLSNRRGAKGVHSPVAQQHFDATVKIDFHLPGEEAAGGDGVQRSKGVAVEIMQASTHPQQQQPNVTADKGPDEQVAPQSSMQQLHTNFPLPRSPSYHSRVGSNSTQYQVYTASSPSADVISGLERRIRELSRQLEHASVTLNVLHFCAPTATPARPWVLTSLPRGPIALAQLPHTPWEQSGMRAMLDRASSNLKTRWEAAQAFAAAAAASTANGTTSEVSPDSATTIDGTGVLSPNSALNSPIHGRFPSLSSEPRPIPVPLSITSTPRTLHTPRVINSSLVFANVNSSSVGVGQSSVTAPSTPFSQPNPVSATTTPATSSAVILPISQPLAAGASPAIPTLPVSAFSVLGLVSYQGTSPNPPVPRSGASSAFNSPIQHTHSASVSARGSPVPSGRSSPLPLLRDGLFPESPFGSGQAPLSPWPSTLAGSTFLAPSVATNLPCPPPVTISDVRSVERLLLHQVSVQLFKDFLSQRAPLQAYPSVQPLSVALFVLDHKRLQITASPQRNKIAAQLALAYFPLDRFPTSPTPPPGTSISSGNSGNISSPSSPPLSTSPCACASLAAGANLSHADPAAPCSVSHQTAQAQALLPLSGCLLARLAALRASISNGVPLSSGFLLALEPLLSETMLSCLHWLAATQLAHFQQSPSFKLAQLCTAFTQATGLTSSDKMATSESVPPSPMLGSSAVPGLPMAPLNTGQRDAQQQLGGTTTPSPFATPQVYHRFASPVLGNTGSADVSGTGTPRQQAWTLTAQNNGNSVNTSSSATAPSSVSSSERSIRRPRPASLRMGAMTLAASLAELSKSAGSVSNGASGSSFFQQQQSQQQQQHQPSVAGAESSIAPPLVKTPSLSSTGYATTVNSSPTVGPSSHNSHIGINQESPRPYTLTHIQNASAGVAADNANIGSARQRPMLGTHGSDSSSHSSENSSRRHTSMSTQDELQHYTVTTTVPSPVMSSSAPPVLSQFQPLPSSANSMAFPPPPNSTLTPVREVRERGSLSASASSPHSGELEGVSAGASASPEVPTRSSSARAGGRRLASIASFTDAASEQRDLEGRAILAGLQQVGHLDPHHVRHSLI